MEPTTTKPARLIWLLRKSADRGDVAAQVKLGGIYEEGFEISQDNEEAVRWYRKAAEQGDVLGQYCLGVMCFNGKGVIQDYCEAIKWFRMAAENGDSASQFRLGAMYSEGNGVTKDYVLSDMWLTLAASRGHKNAIKMQHRIELQMNIDQINQSQDLVRNWMKNKMPSAMFVPAESVITESAATEPATTKSEMIESETAELGTSKPVATYDEPETTEPPDELVISELSRLVWNEAFEQHVMQYKLYIRDNRWKGGALWVITHTKLAAITKPLQDLKFHYKSGKGWWYKGSGSNLVIQPVQSTGPSVRHGATDSELTESAMISMSVETAVSGPATAELETVAPVIIEASTALPTTGIDLTSLADAWALAEQSTGEQSIDQGVNRTTRSRIMSTWTKDLISEPSLSDEKIGNWDRNRSLSWLNDGQGTVESLYKVNSQEKKVVALADCPPLQEYSLPQPIVANPEGFFRLDDERLKETVANTAEAHKMLSEIFAGDPESEESFAIVAPPPPPGLEVVVGLDGEYLRLFHRMAEQTVWERKVFDVLCAELGVFPDGALEILNEAAYDLCGSPLLDGEDPMEVDMEIVKEMRACPMLTK
ncbi:MAG: hypothetical protein H7837_06930 [Magnetococcus sp. MYC-9]